MELSSPRSRCRAGGRKPVACRQRRLCLRAKKADPMPSLTEADNDQTVDLRVGETFHVRLPENATTGYRWTIDRLDDEVVEAVGSEPDYAAGSIGSGGAVTFTFRAKKPGTGDIALKHWRHFEGDASVTNRFRLRLNARP